MRVTAIQIQQWADKRDAQGLLPVLIRKLIIETAKPTELAIPGGDSVGRPGWDGVLTVSEGNPWVPAGNSRWEMGCDKKVADKASGDYRKRTTEYGSTAVDSVFVFVSPRRWFQKAQWRDSVGCSGPWHDVKVLDADDLETWLEAAPATRLWFGELLGLTGPGIRSVESYWDIWRAQSRIQLTTEAISVGRESEIRAFQRAVSALPSILVIEADSTEEAVAFVCAQLVLLGQAPGAACVTTTDGWRYVDANSQLSILIAASIDVAAERAPRDGQMLVVPVNIGDRSDHFSTFRSHANSDRISLERPNADSFEKALVAIGENDADAARYARSTGRSWSVYRRHTAANPAIAHPAWVKDPKARVLTAIVLVGGWNESRPGDTVLLEEITGKKYEELERELLYLARLDDSPVLKIGRVWKAKAPLELLYLYAKEISNEELKRYFATAEAVLTKPDPALELDADKRWMASVYGKVRNESGVVINAIVDSLAKLGVYAETRRDERIISGVDTLVTRLLNAASAERWLSLSGVLRELAEAAPETFLSAVEADLHGDTPAIGQLFTESDGDPMFGRNWHVDLLWALETIAWSPRHLGRVAEILAQLCGWPVRENLVNRPMNTLASLFRPWWPQTTASLQMRLVCVDRVVARHNEVGWDLLVALLPSRFLSASANAKPHWRDDDAGAPAPSKDASVRRCYEQILDRAVAQAQSKPQRIAKLVEDLDTFGPNHCRKIIGLIDEARQFPEEDRELVRAAVRKYLGWHNTYNQDGERGDRTYIEELRHLFDELASTRTSRRHAWLFENGWIELPDGHAKGHREVDATRQEARQQAVAEVFETEGWTGLTELSCLAGDPLLVGWSVAQAGLPDHEVMAWMLDRFCERGNIWHDQLVGGVLHGLNEKSRVALMRRATTDLPLTATAAFLSAASCGPDTWRILEACSEETQQAYWKNIRPGVFLLEGDELKFVVDKLMEVKRHRTAFASIHVGSERGNPSQLLALLEGIAGGEDPDGPSVDQWHIVEAIKRISTANIASRRQLARLEFAYFDGLHHGKSTPHLVAELLTEPELFIECIALAFKPHNGPAEPLDESLKPSAGIAWNILHYGRGLPGRQDNGSIDRAHFDEWIGKVRRRGVEIDRQAVTDLSIGQWLSACPSDSDGTWPCLAVRDLLDRPDTADIRRGFHTGVQNNRGVHNRAPDAGGAQEKDLAGHFRGHASAIVISHPITASVLEDIAKAYDHQAFSEDDDASLIREGVW
jgi:hypothetical protein